MTDKDRRSLLRELAGRNDKFDLVWYTHSGAASSGPYDTVEAAEAAADETISPATNTETRRNMPEDLFVQPDLAGPLLYAGHVCAKTLHWRGHRYAAIVRTPVNEAVYQYAHIGFGGSYDRDSNGQPTEESAWRGLEDLVREHWDSVVYRPCADAHGQPMIAPAAAPADAREAIRLYFDATNASTLGFARCCTPPTPTPPPRPPTGLTLIPATDTWTGAAPPAASWFLYWDNYPIASLEFYEQFDDRER